MIIISILQIKRLRSRSINKLSETTQFGSGGAGIQTHICLTLKPLLFTIMLNISWGYQSFHLDSELKNCQCGQHFDWQGRRHPGDFTGEHPALWVRIYGVPLLARVQFFFLQFYGRRSGWKEHPGQALREGKVRVLGKTHGILQADPLLLLQTAERLYVEKIAGRWLLDRRGIQQLQMGE